MKDLVPGMYMNAEIQQYNYQAYALPEEAVVNFEKENFVLIAEGNNRFEMIPVQTGITQNGQLEIKLGTNNELLNKTFVTEGSYTLLVKLKNTSEDE